MRRAIAALRGHLLTLVRAIDLEGALIIVGTASLAVFAAAEHPYGAFLVVGAVTLALGLALARPPKGV